MRAKLDYLVKQLSAAKSDEEFEAVLTMNARRIGDHGYLALERIGDISYVRDSIPETEEIVA